MLGNISFATVSLSFAIAWLAGFVSFEAIEHLRGSRKPRVWTFLGGLTLGLGIWSMHFIGMLAWVPPFPLYYSLGPTLLSVVAAVAASWLAIHLSTAIETERPEMHLLAGSMVVGGGICGMHYLGMSALLFSQPIQWSTPGVLLSYVVAVFAALGAMAMLHRVPAEGIGLPRQCAASLLIAFAICGMHYTAMFAMMLPGGSTCVLQPGSSSGPALARVGVGNALLLIFCLLAIFRAEKRNLG